MAQVIETTVVRTDDLDGSTENVNELKFGLDGVNYIIDLSEENESKLRETLAPFVGAARKLPRTTNRSRGRANTSRNKAQADEAKAARVWAQEQGKEIPARGRLSAEIMEEYRASQNESNSDSE